MASRIDVGHFAEVILGDTWTFPEIELTNRHTVHAKNAQNKRRVEQLTPKQRKMATEAHHNLMAQRARLGLPMVGQGSPANVQQ